jgi:hypothetical protein
VPFQIKLKNDILVQDKAGKICYSKRTAGKLSFFLQAFEVSVKVAMSLPHCIHAFELPFRQEK